MMEQNLLCSSSSDSYDTAINSSVSSDNVVEEEDKKFQLNSIIIDSSIDIEANKENNCSKNAAPPRLRPTSLTLKRVSELVFDDFITCRRENSAPVTELEKSRCLHRTERITSKENPSSINILALVKFIRMKSLRARSIRFPVFSDEESTENEKSSRKSSSSARNSASIFLCSICLENQMLSDAASFRSCHNSHIFCRQCLSSFITMQIRDGVILHVCPFEGCQEVATDEDIRQLVTEEAFVKYIRFREMKLNPSYRECSRCLQQISIPEDFFNAEGVADRPILNCISCGAVTCFYHGDAHPSESCAMYAKRIRKQELASRSLLTRIARRCPQCRAETEKTGGCNHMVDESFYGFRIIAEHLLLRRRAAIARAIGAGCAGRFSTAVKPRIITIR